MKDIYISPLGAALLRRLANVQREEISCPHAVSAERIVLNGVHRDRHWHMFHAQGEVLNALGTDRTSILTHPFLNPRGFFEGEVCDRVNCTV